MKKIYLLFIGFAVILSSCFDDPGTEILFDGNYVELDAAGTPSRQRTYSYLKDNDNSADPIGATVLRSSTNADDAVTVNLTVDPASTAIEGFHYRLNSSVVTIPAGSFSAPIDADIFADNIGATERLDLIFKIADASVDVNADLDSANHELVVACTAPGTFVGSYTLTSDVQNNFGPSFGPDGTVVTLSETSLTDRVFVADYLAGGFPTPITLRFLCDDRVTLVPVDTNVGCPGNDVNLTLGPDADGLEGQFVTSDDGSFTLIFDDNVDSDCGYGPLTITYTFTKN